MAGPGGGDHVLPDDNIPRPERLGELPALVGLCRDDVGEVQRYIQRMGAI